MVLSMVPPTTYKLQTADCQPYLSGVLLSDMQALLVTSDSSHLAESKFSLHCAGNSSSSDSDDSSSGSERKQRRRGPSHQRQRGSPLSTPKARRAASPLRHGRYVMESRDSGAHLAAANGSSSRLKSVVQVLG